MEGRRVRTTRTVTVSSDHSPLWRTFPEYLMNNISFYSQSLSSGEQTNNLTRSTVCNLTWSHFIFFSFKISTSSAPTTRCLTSNTWSAQTGSRSTVTRSWRWVSSLEIITSYPSPKSCAWPFLRFFPLFVVLSNWNLKHETLYYLCCGVYFNSCFICNTK